MDLIKSNKEMTVFGYPVEKDYEITKWGDDHIALTQKYIRNNIAGENQTIIKPSDYGTTQEGFIKEVQKLNQN